MDYKTFIHEFDIRKKELVEFITTRNTRNISRVEEMVSQYLEQIADGDYSIKSYKAKVIHNELDCNHAIRDVDGIRDKVFGKLQELVGNYFLEYSNDQVDENIPKQKVKDMRDYVNKNRQQKHEVLLKKNNIEKDFTVKSKELDSEKKEKLNSYNEKINSLKMRLVNELKKLNEKTIKDYSEYELTLLDENDKTKIKELKEKIKEIRRQSLDEEYNIKMASYDEILQEELSFTHSYQEFIYELEKYRMEMQVKLAELERDNTLLSIDSDYNDKLYDIKLDRRVNKHFNDEIKRFSELTSIHDNVLSKDYSDKVYDLDSKVFLYDLASLYIYSLLIRIHRSDRYHPFGNILSTLASLCEKQKEAYLKTLDDIKPLKEKEKEDLTKALDSFPGNPKKKITKDDLVNNALESLDRYYDNYIKEIDYYNMIYSSLLIDFIFMLNKGYEEKNKEDTLAPFVSNITNYDYIDLSKYNYQNNNEASKEVTSIDESPKEDASEEVTLEDTEEASVESTDAKDEESNENEPVEATTEEVATNESVNEVSNEDTIKSQREELINSLVSNFDAKDKEVKERIESLNALKKAQDDEVNSSCDKKIEIYNQEYKEIVEKNKKELLSKEKEVVKATSKSKDKARKLLQESKKAL